ncbi:MAG: hypothetical protein V3W41_06185 [Planctomycetota bacterium]
MLSLFKSFRNQAEVSRLRKRGQLDSRPGTYLELCRTLLSQGEVEKAAESAQEGLDRFPHSQELRRILRHAFRQLKSAECEELRKRCRTNGDREDFLKLAKIHIECDVADEALVVLEELHRQEGEAPDALLLQAQILFERFYRDQVASDAKRGIALASRSLEANDKSFVAHLAMAQLHHNIGATSKALFHVYRALDIEPDQEEALELYNHLAGQALESEDVATLLRKVEEGVDDGLGAQQVELSDEKRAEASQGLMRLSDMHGVNRAVLVDRGLTLVAENGKCKELANDQDDSLCRIAREYPRMASLSSKRMGIGAFESSRITAGDRILQFYSVGSMVLVIESDEPKRADLISAECVSFVASCLRLDEEEPVDA